MRNKYQAVLQIAKGGGKLPYAGQFSPFPKGGEDIYIFKDEWQGDFFSCFYAPDNQDG